MHELPLVFLTVFAQAAAGSYAILLLARWLDQISDRQLAVGLFVSICVFGLGMLLGSAHLGQPFRALNTLFGFGRSPMSNEIVCTAVFGIFGGLGALGLVLNKGPKGLLNLCATIGAIAGIGFIAVVPSVYRIATVVTWDSNYTAIVMVLTALVVGGALSAACGAVRLGAAISIVGIIASLSAKVGYTAFINQVGGELAVAQTCWLSVQTLLLALGLVLMVKSYAKCQCSQKLALIAVVGLLLAELAGRVAFYNLWVIPL